MMKVIWKRPDGFHEASPSDYFVVEVSANVKIWLHKRDQEHYPFRVSGGWQDEAASQKLNRFVNLIQKSTPDWVLYLTDLFHHSDTDSQANFLKRELEWFDELGRNLKGDTWEVEIMSETLKVLKQKVQDASAAFLKTRS